MVQMSAGFSLLLVSVRTSLWTRHPVQAVSTCQADTTVTATAVISTTATIGDISVQSTSGLAVSTFLQIVA